MLDESSQLHIKSNSVALAGVGMLASHRAEQSRRSTVRSTSLEAGLLFISFDDLLNHTADLVCTVVDKIFEKHGDKILKMNPSFQALARLFPPTTYVDVITTATSTGPSTRGSCLSLWRTSRRT